MAGPGPGGRGSIKKIKIKIKIQKPKTKTTFAKREVLIVPDVADLPLGRDGSGLHASLE